jgi:hypothetical protein
MKFWALVGGFVLLGMYASGQSVDWRKATDWNFYAVHGRDIWKLSVDSLDQFLHVRISEDSIRFFLVNSTMIDDKNVPVWMGGFVLRYRLGQRTLILLASSYGGRFYDEGSKQWFRVADDHRGEWSDYLAALAAAADKQ